MAEAKNMSTQQIQSGYETPVAFKTAANDELKPVMMDHVPDFCHRYPGELVTFYTRVHIRELLSDLKLRIAIPQGLVLHEFRPLFDHRQAAPFVEVTEETSYVVWTLSSEVSPGTAYEYETVARVSQVRWYLEVDSSAEVSTRDQTLLAEETTSVTILTRGTYLRYLPAIYEQDDLIGRFLMLFESFWAPIEAQVDTEPYYFDPRLTPEPFLPWLASWLDLELDERWPEAQRRQLIRWAIALHRSRGTKWGLLKYLSIYTGQQAQIVEYRAKNLILGAGARLGPSIAMGQGNAPHTFSVTLRLPPVAAKDEPERLRQEEIRRKTIEAIIERQKPAHTVYTLKLESLLVLDLPDEKTVQTGQVEDEVDEVAARAALWFNLDE